MNYLRISGFLCILVACQGSYFSRNHVSVIFNPFILSPDLGSFANYTENQLAQMISTISTRFSKVLIQNIEPQAFHRIPMEIAKFNKYQRIPGEEALELAISYKLGEPGRELENLKFVLELGEKANSVFAGSVKSLILDCSEIQSLESILTKEELLEAIKKITHGRSFSYQTGLILPISECSKVSDLHRIEDYFELFMFSKLGFSVMKETYDLLDSIAMFSRFGFSSTTETYDSLDSIVIKTTMEMKQCQQMILAGLKEETKLSFITSVDVYPSKIQNSQDFVQFWLEMNMFAEQTNTSVVLLEAFDSFWKSSPQSNLGWWRSKPEGANNGAGWRWGFEEKLRDIAIFPELEKVINELNFFHRFSPDHVMVSFDSRFSPEENETIYKESKVISGMIDLIATKFTKVVLHPTSPSRYKAGKSGAFLALEIAQWNYLHSKSMQAPLIVVMQYLLQPAGNETDPNSFEITKSLADHANDIYPGTVTSIILYNEGNDSDISFESIQDQLKSVNMSGKYRYNIGVAVPLMFCGELDHQMSQFKEVVLLSNEIIVYHNPDERRMELGVDSFMSISETYYERCVKNLEAFGSKASLHLELSWLGKNDRDVVNIANLVNLWMKADTLARNKNINVILAGSFNSYDGENPPKLRNNGWWRFENQRGKFVEKITALDNYYERNAFKPEKKSCRDCHYECDCTFKSVSNIIVILFVIGFLWWYCAKVTSDY